MKTKVNNNKKAKEAELDLIFISSRNKNKNNKKNKKNKKNLLFLFPITSPQNTNSLSKNSFIMSPSFKNKQTKKEKPTQSRMN